MLRPPFAAGVNSAAGRGLASLSGGVTVILLPLLAGMLGFRIVQRVCGDWRRALLLAAIAWQLVLLGITELLSLLPALDRSGVLVAWLAVDAAAAFALLHVWLTRPAPPCSPS